MIGFDVLSCAQRLKPWIIHTPLVEVEYLSERLKKRVFLKLESMQKTRAFKFRGAMNFLLTMNQQEAKQGVITASSGNHGLGLALSGKLTGLGCTVVMPRNAALVKQERAKAYGATVILHGHCYDEAQEYAKVLAEENGYLYVSSFNSQAVIEGQGTIYAEILAELPETEIIFAPIGGGGLVSGLLLAKEQLKAGAVVVGVEPYGAACMKASLAANALVTLENLHTIAGGVAVRTPGSQNFAIVNHYKPSICLVSDEEIRATQKELLNEARLIVETAGAVSVAGLLSGCSSVGASTVVCIVSGANVDRAELLELLD